MKEQNGKDTIQQSENTVNEECYLLLSSNYRKEYILDSIETIALPIGFIQHYRYKKTYVANEIYDLLKDENDKLDKRLKDKDILIGMLFQEKVSENYNWLSIVPTRKAKLKHAFKTGDTENSVAHFYFEVQEFTLPKDNFFTDVKAVYGVDFGKKYAKPINITENQYYEVHEQGTKIFNDLCEKIRINDFNQGSAKCYSKPLYIFLEGIKNKKGKHLKPKYNALTRKSYYELEEGSHYSIHYTTYSNDDDNYSVNFRVDDKCFSTPEEYKVVINSNYDKNSVDLVPSMLDRNTRSILELDINICDIKDSKSTSPTSHASSGAEGTAGKPEVKDNLDISIPISIFIKTKTWTIFVEWIGEIGIFLLSAIVIIMRLFSNNSNSTETTQIHPFFQWINNYLPYVIFTVLFLLIVSKLVIKFYKKK